jgi:hypothetical protein
VLIIIDKDGEMRCCYTVDRGVLLLDFGGMPDGHHIGNDHALRQVQRRWL